MVKECSFRGRYLGRFTYHNPYIKISIKNVKYNILLLIAKALTNYLSSKIRIYYIANNSGRLQ